MRQFLAGVVEHIRNLIITRVAKEPGWIIELPAADMERIKQQAAGTETDRLIMLFDSLSRTLDEMRWSPHQRFTLEVGLVKACSVEPLKPLGEVLEHMKTLEAQLGSGGTNTASRPETVRERPAGYTPPGRAASSAPARAGASPAPGDPWEKIMSELRKKRPSFATTIASSRILENTADTLVVGIAGTTFQLEQAERKDNLELVEQLASEALNKRVQVKFRRLEEDKKTGTRATSAKKPAPQEQDPFVKDALSIFNGQIIEPDGNEGND
jgi:DNA polymerase III gamma/tau subunit